ncbi:TetR/AcrR family transcriptional regulator [Methylocella sp.]|uniref:TetR/AcrR family transcriptional regulator n=1 Tax=Methylocella sp. TaxID=1978226 RepID=UPI00378459EC
MDTAESIEARGAGQAAAALKRVPRGAARRRQIAAVAEAIFLERGYSDATMQAIATRAEASKETLYRHFGSKAELFAAVVRARAQKLDAVSDELRGAPHAALSGFCAYLLRFVTQPDSLRLYRVVLAESPREPELGRIFFELGPGRLIDRLAGYLAAATAAGALSCPEPLAAARLLVGAVVAWPQMATLILDAPPAAELDRHAREAVVMFLARFGVAGAPAG